MRIIVTGGAGFIGSAVIRFLMADDQIEVLNVDKLTYVSNLDALASVAGSNRYQFAKVDIVDRKALDRLFGSFKPDAVMHLAAESHVDRSIDGPAAFIRSNIVGTYTLLEAARAYWAALGEPRRSRFRFLQVSTDEVYGDLGPDEAQFTETTPYAPSSPYSASKASSDHLARAWHRTYGLPVVITNCSNNYGPYQFPEKLIPLMILNAMEGSPLPVYGDGRQVRDWLHVEDHARALHAVLASGKVGETYNIGGCTEVQNITVVQMICELLDEVGPQKPPSIAGYADLITHVRDRPGHDRRYAMDTSKIERELGWAPRETFEMGLRKTVAWYLEHLDWCRSVQGEYRRERLGVNA